MKINHCNTKIIRDEQETVINYRHLDNAVIIDTTEPSVMTKCSKAGYELIEQTVLTSDETYIVGQVYKTTCNKISFRSAINSEA